MIIEHRTYTFKPGTIDGWLEKYQSEGLPIQKRHLGQSTRGSKCSARSSRTRLLTPSAPRIRVALQLEIAISLTPSSRTFEEM